MAISLRAARANAGLTQTQAAAALKISKGTLGNYEKYRTKPDIEMAKKMASLYGMGIDDIIFLLNDCALSAKQDARSGR